MDEKLYGLIGFPLGHSFSQSYFTEKFQNEGIKARYVNFEIPRIDMIRGIVADEKALCGFNVTIPYKQKIIEYLSAIDPIAAEIGAVNVVKVGKNGRLKGYNSDVFGFTESLLPLLQPFVHKRALVLGVGGASRAVCHGLKSLGLTVTQVSRRPGVGNLLYSDLSEEIIKEHTVIVNTTPLGMYPDVNTFPNIPYKGITPHHVCFDLVYNPETTTFMKFCEEQGAKVKNGLEMLHLQAERAWQIWSDDEEQ